MSARKPSGIGGLAVTSSTVGGTDGHHHEDQSHLLDRADLTADPRSRGQDSLGEALAASAEVASTSAAESYKVDWVIYDLYGTYGQERVVVR